MFRRTVVVVVAVALVALPAQDAFARKHAARNGNQISIKVSENPVVAGDQLAIFGRLTGANAGGRQVVLWHRINPRARFTPVQTTSTDANGYYLFDRQPGVVDSNRNWYVKSSGARSRTVHERVYAAVTLSGPPEGSTLLSGPAHRTTFTGTVQPYRAGTVVLLQRQNSAGNGNGWGTIDRTRVQGNGAFSIAHTFRVPGDASIRVLVKPTVRNIATPSDSLDYQVSQAQNPRLTLVSSANPIYAGQPVTLSGTLANGASKTVTLLGRTAYGGFRMLAQVTADSNGAFTFTQAPLFNTIYRVRGGGRSSAQLFEGVHDVLTAAVSATTVDAGQPVTFSGTVSPDKTGHVIYLQRQNVSGTGFHTVQVTRVGAGSAYTITRRLFVPGTKVFRVLIPGGPANEKAASQPFTITVNPASPQQVNQSQPDNTSAG